MWAVLNENPTREKIILLLKKRGPLAIEELSKELNITSMGIRQHLLSLERRGLIEYITKRQGIGRPAFLYKLSEKANDLFPKEYDKLILNLFHDIEKNEGREKIDEIFKWRKNRIIKEVKEIIGDKKNLPERVLAMRDILENEGYFAELNDSNNHYTLKLYNCPIYKLASIYKEVCKHDLQMFKELISKDLTRQECIIDGHPSCTYIIPKTASKN
ncbi:MAG: transcriptional regulator [Nitrospirae bacterium]|jgi:predicted ArsR family transcriptional regulator|nr:transcriptional regulator [Nitrospirota bacterium]